MPALDPVAFLEVAGRTKELKVAEGRRAAFGCRVNVVEMIPRLDAGSAQNAGATLFIEQVKYGFRSHCIVPWRAGSIAQNFERTPFRIGCPSLTCPLGGAVSHFRTAFVFLISSFDFVAVSRSIFALSFAGFLASQLRVLGKAFLMVCFIFLFLFWSASKLFDSALHFGPLSPFLFGFPKTLFDKGVASVTCIANAVALAPCFDATRITTFPIRVGAFK